MSTHFFFQETIIYPIYAKYFSCSSKKKKMQTLERLIDMVTGQQLVSFKDILMRKVCVILMVTASCLQQDAFSPSVTVSWTDRKLQITFSSSSTAVWCTLPAGCTLLVQMWPSPRPVCQRGLLQESWPAKILQVDIQCWKQFAILACHLIMYPLKLYFSSKS